MKPLHNPEIFVSARPLVYMNGLEIVVYKRVAGDMVSCLTIDHKESLKAGSLVYRWGDPVACYSPISKDDVFLQIADFAPQLVAALSDQGYTLPEKSFIEGKLTAVESHLKDMQRLVFKDKVIS